MKHTIIIKIILTIVLILLMIYNYNKVLKETNICPICRNTFDDHQIEHIVME